MMCMKEKQVRVDASNSTTKDFHKEEEEARNGQCYCKPNSKM